MRDLLLMTYQKQKQFEKRFEEYLMSYCGYGSGETYNDKNMKIIYKTFLKAGPKKQIINSGSQRSVAQ